MTGRRQSPPTVAVLARMMRTREDGRQSNRHSIHRGVRMARPVFLVIGIVAAGCPALRAQSPTDSGLVSYIAGVKAIDNHAHPLLPAIPGVPPDTDYDALPLGAIPPFLLPTGLGPNNPATIAAWHALYGYAYDDASDPHVKELLQTKARAAAERGDRAAEWALDQMGTDVMLANRVAMGRGLGPPRFRWVAFVDPLLLPLNTAREGAASPDFRPLYPREARLLRRYLAALPVAALPPTLPAYLATVVTPTLARMKDDGAVAVKFEAAYLRPLDFGNPPLAAAAAIYARYVRGGTPTHAEYKTLQDFIFRYIARDAGRIGLAVHIHCMYLAGGFYRVSGSRPMQLEDVFNDSTLRHTQFVLLHGGWPFVGETLAMIGKPNVYADMSLMTGVLSPATLAGVLREWLEEYPGKVLYGSDAFADHNDDPVGWADEGWISARTGRRALAIALTAMMRDGDITRERAEQIARMVLRGNAATLYGIGTP
jgi:uncharacterized protein